MNTMQKILATTALAMGVAMPLASHAQSTPAQGQAAATQANMLTDGEIRKVDADNSKVTIKHGDIKNLDMPGMTMVFPVKDKNLLSGVKAGDKVKFVVIKEGGKMVVTEIRPAS